MKLSLLTTLLVAYPFTCHADVREKGGDATHVDPRVRSVVYSPDAIVNVPVRRGVVTHIVLGEDEVVRIPPAMGKGADCARDTDTWCVVASGRDVFIKPRTGADMNNMVLVTTRRRHAFVFNVVSPKAADAVIRLSILPPPQPQRPAPAVALGPTPLSAEELIANRMRVEPQVRNKNYSVAVGKDSEDIVPVMVFDDGTQTYFSFPNNRPVPTVFSTAPDQSEEMVNVRMEGDKLVADRVARRFVLRLGNSVIAIINEDFDIDGVPPANGTTVPGVARALRATATTEGASR
jgi:type IV secretion system protein VirB9